MRSIVMVAVLVLGVAGCGQTEKQAEADLAAKEATYVPKPAEPGAVFVGEVPPAQLQDYTPPVETPVAE